MIPFEMFSGQGVGVQSAHDSVGYSQDEGISRGTLKLLVGLAINFVTNSFRSVRGFFFVPFKFTYGGEGYKANSFISLPIDAVIWTEHTATMILPVFG